MSSSHNITLGMFDFDGTLFDTSEALYLAYARAFKEVTGKKVIRSVWDTYFGAHVSVLGRCLGLNDSEIDEVRRLKYKIYPGEFFDHIKPIQATIDAARAIAGPKYVVSNTETTVTSWILEHFGQKEVFHRLFGPDDFTQRKPSPQPYVSAYMQCDPLPKTVLIFEDSEVGLASARTATQMIRTMTQARTQVVRVDGEELVWE